MSKNRETNKDLKLDGPIEKGISSSRRQFTKASLLASPVLMSVVSRPVFGVGCLSNMLSGNLSDPNRGECNLGLSPGYWKEHPEAWPMASTYRQDGTLPTGQNDCLSGGGPFAQWECGGGALFNSYFTSGPLDANNRTMYEILCTEAGSDEFHIIAALLNAMTDPNYVLSVDQVKTLWADPTLGGQVTNFKSFLNSTWT
ncbi:hypothetical protein [Sedimenticola hydrogenitrophicus]|uniref:hypothetical protein n=1 Tax=Sedimenticola hydrogenitrophicus TaxID=2967975 RepID=UPI0021A2634B|nr:hypothetical protein [Sedimenticola hydrogenitrophicus]